MFNLLGDNRKRKAKVVQIDDDADIAIPNAGDAHAIDAELYHGSDKKIEGKLRPTKTRGIGLPEPTGVSLATNPKTASQFGNAVYPVKAKGKVGDAELFMRRARQHMRRGANDDEASARTQKEFSDKGYNGVRWGDREIVLWDAFDFALGDSGRKKPEFKKL